MAGLDSVALFPSWRRARNSSRREGPTLRAIVSRCRQSVRLWASARGPGEVPGRSQAVSLPRATRRHRTSTRGWRTAGLFFLLPGVGFFLKPDVPVAAVLVAATGCLLGATLCARRCWPAGIRRLGVWIPVVGAGYLLCLRALTGAHAFETWEVALWYAAGLLWMGVTQPARWLRGAPGFVVTFVLTTPTPRDAGTLVAAVVTVAVMTLIASLVAADMSRARQAHVRMRQAVRRLTAIAQTDTAAWRHRSSAIDETTVATALELGFSGAGVLGRSGARWVWHSWRGTPMRRRPQDARLGRFVESLGGARRRRITDDGREMVLVSLQGHGDHHRVLVVDAPAPVDDDQLHALDLLAAHTARGLEMRRIAFHDALTDLPMRPLFEERLGEQLACVHRDRSYGFALAYLDLDDFKAINDREGHDVGDRVLVELARRLQHALRALDEVVLRGVATPSRLGGDEFAILLPGVASPETAMQIAGRLSETVSHPVDVDGRALATRASIGIVMSDPHLTDAREMMRRADRAMYAAKRSSRRTCMVRAAGVSTSHGATCAPRHGLAVIDAGPVGMIEGQPPWGARWVGDLPAAP